jgi:hypothetical protein
LNAVSLGLFFCLTLSIVSCTPQQETVETVPYACQQIPGVAYSTATSWDEYGAAVSRRLNTDPVIQQILATEQVHEVLGVELLITRNGNVIGVIMIGCARLRQAQNQIFARAHAMNFGAFPPGLQAKRAVYFVSVIPPHLEFIRVVNPLMAAPPPPNGPVQFEAAQARWEASMPVSFVPLWHKALPQIMNSFMVFNGPAKNGRPAQPPAAIALMAPFQTALANEFPSSGDQILALLSWYGSGLGPWSGYPSYESFAAYLLDTYPITAIIGATTAQPLTPAQEEGAARYLAADINIYGDTQAARMLPASLKQEFINRALESGDQDKILRAENAFSQ